MGLKDSYWIKSIAYSFGSRFSILLFGFGGFYFLVRSLSQAQFGNWALFLTITTIIETSRNGLIQNALIKLLFSHPAEDSDKIITASWLINIFYSAFIFIILVALSGVLSKSFHSEEIRTMFLLYGITLLLLIPFSQFNFIQQSKFSFSGIFWGAFARQGAFFIMIVVIYFKHLEIGLNSLVLLQAGGTFIGLIVSFFCARKYLTFKAEWSWPITKEVFHFGKYVMGTNISSLFFKSTDQFMIGHFLTTVQVALYNSATRVSNLIEYPTTAIAEVVYPKSASKFETDGEASSKNFFEKSVALTMLLTLPTIAFTVLFADYIIYIIAGPLYAESATLLRITILFGLFSPFSRQFGTAMDSSGRPHLNFIILVIGIVINLILNYFGVKMMGTIGAAYATLCSYTILNIIYYILMVRIFNVSMLSIIRYMIDYPQQGWNYLKKKRGLAV